MSSIADSSGGRAHGLSVQNRTDLPDTLVAALLKRWLIGTHQGAVSREHLDYYLDEYTFRFNRRRSRHRGKLFYRLVQQAATVGPTTYSEMVQHLCGRRTGQPQDVG